MKRYEYENVSVHMGFGERLEEHREIIDRYAANGYRYAGYIPTCVNLYGKIEKLDLVFEIDMDE